MFDIPRDKKYKAFFREDAESQVLEQVQALPPDLKELGFFILDRKKNGKKIGISLHSKKSYQAKQKREKAFYS